MNSSFFFCRKWFFDLKVVLTFLSRGLNMGHGKLSSKIQGLVNINDYNEYHQLYHLYNIKSIINPFINIKTYSVYKNLYHR